MNFFIVAGIVTILSILILFIFIIRGKWQKMHLILLSLPLSFIANSIKGPLYFLLCKIFGIKEPLNEWPIWFTSGITIIGAAIEEIVKILPLLLLMKVVAKIKMDKKSIYCRGLILGAGFGIGEIWLVALSAALTEVDYTKGLKNFLMILSGFGTERLMAVFIHTFLTGIVAFGVVQKRLFRYFLVATFLHSIINIPAVLFQKGLFSQRVSSFLIMMIFCLFMFIFFKINKKSEKFVT